MSNLVERLRWWGAKRKAPKGMDTLPSDCREAADRIEELEQAGRLVEEWWLEQGAKHFDGAPYAIFALRSVLSNSVPTLLQEQKANAASVENNGGKRG